MTWNLTYLKPIPAKDLLLRIWGPDEHGVAYFVARVRHQHRNGGLTTQAELQPVPRGWTHTMWRAGKEWILPTAVETDGDGVAHLVRSDG
jgi:hypothetical protein